MRDLNEDISNNWNLWHDNKITDGHIYNGCIPSSFNRCSDYVKDVVKRTILEHEAIFRKQVHELHHLYKIQKELMEELLKNSLNRCSKHEINSKARSSKPEIQSQGCTRIWQTSHWSDINSFQRREKSIVIDSNICPSRFCERNTRTCLGLQENGASEGNGASHTSLGTCTRRLPDLRLLADVYIDSEDPERTEKDFDGSSSLTTVPYSKDSKLYPNGEVKHSLVSISGPKGWKGTDNLGSHSKNGPPNGLVDLNEPIEGRNSFMQSACSFPLQLFEPERQLKENHKHNVSLREIKPLLESALSKVEDFGERGFSTILPSFKAETTPTWSLMNSKAGKYRGLMSTDSVKEECWMSTGSVKDECLVFSAPMQLKLTESNDVVSRDVKKAKAQPLKHGNCFLSGKSPGCATRGNSDKLASLANSVTIASHMDINFTSSPLAFNSSVPLEAVSPFDCCTKENLTRLETSSEDTFCDRWEVGRELRSLDIKDVSSSRQYRPICGVQFDSSSSALPKPLFTNSNLSIHGSSCQQNERKQDPSSNLEAFTLDLHGSEEKPQKDKESNSLSRQKSFGNLLFNNIDLNLGCLDQEQLLENNPQHGVRFCYRKSVNSEHQSSHEKTRSLKDHIDLNCEAPFMNELSFSEVSAKCHISIPSLSKTSPVDLEAPATNLEGYNIPQINLNLSSEREDVLQNGCFPEMVMREAAENIIKLSSDKLIKQTDDELSSLSTTTQCNSLHWLAYLALNAEVNTNIVSYCSIASPCDGKDLFELMTLQLEEIKPEELWHMPRELENAEDDERNRILLLQTRRGKVRKRRQRRDFQKDILPGLATLSRQEVKEDLQAFGELMKASGYPWLAGKGRRNSCRNGTQTRAKGRRQPRNVAQNFTEFLCGIPQMFLSNKTVHNPEFEVERSGMIGWGRTRRCRRQRCPSLSFATALV